jgi:hypothetical protein
MSIDTPTTDDVVEEVKTDIFSELQAQRAKIGAGSPPLDLDVPGYDGKLVLRFTWIPIKQLARTGPQLAKIKEPTAQQVAAAADAIAATCSEILVRVDGKLESLSVLMVDPENPSANDIPVTFIEGERVAFALGFTKAPDARTTVIRAFKNEYALLDVAQRLSIWLEDTSKNVNEEYVGE